MAEDTGRDTLCEPLVQVVTPAQLEELFFFLWRKRSRSAVRAGRRRVELEAEDTQVGLS